MTHTIHAPPQMFQWCSVCVSSLRLFLKTHSGSFSSRFCWHLATRPLWKLFHCLGEIRRELWLLLVCLIKYWCFCWWPNHLLPGAMAFPSLADVLALPVSLPFLCTCKIILASGLLHLPFLPSGMSWYLFPWLVPFSFSNSAQMLFLQTDSVCITPYKVDPAPSSGGVFYYKILYYQDACEFQNHLILILLLLFWFIPPPNPRLPPWERKGHKSRGHACLLCSRHCPNGNSVKLKLLPFYSWETCLRD